MSAGGSPPGPGRAGGAGSEARPIARAGTPRRGAVPGESRSPQPGPAPRPLPHTPPPVFHARASSLPPFSPPDPASPPSPLPTPRPPPPSQPRRFSRLFLFGVVLVACLGLFWVGHLSPNFRRPPCFPSPHSGSRIARTAAPSSRTWEASTCFTDEKTEAGHVLSLFRLRGSSWRLLPAGHRGWTPPPNPPPATTRLNMPGS